MSERQRIEGPSRCNIEPQVWSDPRFRMMALKTGLDVFSVVGRHARVWAECTTRNVYELAEDEIDLFAEWPGFAAAMVAYKLARRTEAGLYLCGTKGRVEWLDGMLKQRSAAGKESARKRAEQKAAAKSHAEYEAPARDHEGSAVGGDGPAVDDEGATTGQRPVERPMNETPTSVERQRTSGSGSGSDGSSPTVKTGVALDRPGRPRSQPPDPDSETEKSASPRARSQGAVQEASAKDDDTPAEGDDGPAVAGEEATTGQLPVERLLNETPTSVERQRTSGSGSGSDGSSPTVKTGVALDLPGLSPSQLPDPDSETETSASPRARSQRVLPYTAPEVYAVLAEAMGELFVAEMPGGEKIPRGIATQVNKALKQAGDAGFTLDQIRQVGEHTAPWMRARGSTQPLTPAWVATTDVNQAGLLRGLTKLAARRGARASPPAEQVTADQMAEWARDEMERERAEAAGGRA